jgi:hypothetical protein
VTRTPAEDARMPDEMSQLLRRMDMAERNMSDAAKTSTEIIEAQREMREELGDVKTDRAVRAERDKNLHERLERMEKTIEAGLKAVKEDIDGRFNRLRTPLWAAALAFISALIAAIANFIIKGGLSV